MSCLIYQYSNKAPRLLGQPSTFGVVFFLLRELRQRKLKNVQLLFDSLEDVLKYWYIIELGLLVAHIKWF